MGTVPIAVLIGYQRWILWLTHMVVMRRGKPLILFCNTSSNRLLVSQYCISLLPQCFQTVPWVFWKRQRHNFLGQQVLQRVSYQGFAAGTATFALWHPQGAFQLCSVQRCLLTSFRAYSTGFTLLLRGSGMQAIYTWMANHQTPWQTGCGWTCLDFLTSWHFCLGRIQPRRWNAESAGKELTALRIQAVTVFLYIDSEHTLCLILHWSSEFERLWQKHKQFRTLTPAICSRRF